jgi:hypothetical protein
VAGFAGKPASTQYPTNSLLYKARAFFFYCKIVLTVFTAGALVFTLAQKFT